AAREVDVDVVAGQADPGAPGEDRHEQGHAVRVDAAGRPTRRSAGPWRDEALDLDEERPRSLEGRRHDAARRRPVVLGEERPSRVGDLTEATIAHLEDADLIRRAEP